RMESASQITYPALVLMVLNRLEKGPPVIDEHYAGVLMTDLVQRRPRFIIHVGDQGMNPELYRLENFPPVVELLDREYVHATTRNGCDVYVRGDDPVATTKADPLRPTRDAATEAVVEVRVYSSDASTR